MATAKKAAPAKRTPNAAFLKPLTPSADLAAIIGSTPMPRTEVTKKVWEYIKKHNLQDAANKRNINADDKLKVIFKKPRCAAFIQLRSSTTPSKMPLICAGLKVTK